MYLLSCFCLSFVGFSCLVGCYARGYHDNLGQRLGMIVLGIGCVARVPAIWQAQAVNNDWFLIHGGMALVAASTMWRHRNTLNRPYQRKKQ